MHTTPAPRKIGILRLVSEDESAHDEVDFLLDNMIADASADEIGSVSWFRFLGY